MQELLDKVKSDPNLGKVEQEFSVNFTKEDEMAWIHSTIAPQVKRLIAHSDVVTTQITTYNAEEHTYSSKVPDEVEDDEVICRFSGKVPIESLKVQKNPRSQRGYANIISNQAEVVIDGK